MCFFLENISRRLNRNKFAKMPSSYDPVMPIDHTEFSISLID